MNTSKSLNEIIDKLWNDAWGKAGLYDFDGTGEDTLSKPQAKAAIVEAVEGLIGRDELETDDLEFLWAEHRNKLRAELRLAIKEWQ